MKKSAKNMLEGKLQIIVLLYEGEEAGRIILFRGQTGITKASVNLTRGPLISYLNGWGHGIGGGYAHCRPSTAVSQALNMPELAGKGMDQIEQVFIDNNYRYIKGL